MTEKCKAYRSGDTMYCGSCHFQWEVGDADRPTCNPVKAVLTKSEWRRKLPSLHRAVDLARVHVKAAGRNKAMPADQKELVYKTARTAEDELAAWYRKEPK